MIENKKGSYFQLIAFLEYRVSVVYIVMAQ